MVYLFIFLIGLIFGSFASVVIHRLHTGSSGIFTGRSKCPRCAQWLGIRDLIPLVSYVINKFRCRFCKEPIAMRYPLLELFMGGIFVLTTFLVGFASVPALVFYLLMSFVFVLLAFYDFLFKEVPDQVSIPAFFAFLAYAIGADLFSGWHLTLGILIPVLFFGFLYFGSGGRWLGGGDIRIGALMGALLGYPMILVGLFFGYLSGTVFSLGGLALGKLNRRSQVPFAPFLLLGTYTALFWGQDVIDWYFGLM